MQVEYIGEHLLPGKLGNIFVILSFISALYATFSFFYAEIKNDNSWRIHAINAFRMHTVAVIGIASTLFYMIFKHYFEYQYVWQHSSSVLPFKYMLSCFWEGQEGSFLLWTFWHCILGNIIIYLKDEHLNRVMTIFSSVQIFLASMLLGVFIFDYRIGSNPFLLLREHPEFMNLPFTKMPDYLAGLDGRGLNPLLQNYWMTIHPPTLFLGFALTLVPFSYAISGLWKNNMHSWLKPALPWTYLGIMILGVGILMGGAWAYESLSFGGFWAWDPVENASLVPWLTLVGGAHLMLIHKNKGSSLFYVFVLILITFILILYSTFLTRSGILGDTSVHAFTDLGMSGQLLIYLFAFLLLAIVLLWMRKENFKTAKTEEEKITSREFWMFIGSLILLIGAFQIIFSTSIPVINKIFSTKLAPPSKPIEHYNSWQVPIATLVALLIAFTQFLKYKSTNTKQFFKSIAISFVISLLITVAVSIGLEMDKPFYIALLFTSLFATIANFQYFISGNKIKFIKGGASIAHVGMGLILLGALISTSKSEVISRNSSGLDVSKLGKDFNNAENILLRIGDTLQMGKYHVTYKGKRQEGLNHYFDVDYFVKNNKNFDYQFTLSPFVQTNPKMGNSAEPSTKHYWNKDVYTHVTYADLSDLTDKKGKEDEYKIKNTHHIATGDTVFTGNSIVVVEGLTKELNKTGFNLEENDIAVAAVIKVLDVKGEKSYAYPIFVVRGNSTFSIPFKLDALGLQFDFVSLNPDDGKLEIEIKEKEDKNSKFIVMKAIIFPYINILWIGCIVMALGTLMSVISRASMLRKQ